MKRKYSIFLFLVFLFSHSCVFAQKDSVRFTLSFEKAAMHQVHVSMNCRVQSNAPVIFKMPQWTPGYYQIMNYASFVSNFRAEDEKSRLLEWKKINTNTWEVTTGNSKIVHLNYDVLANKAFVANSVVDTDHAYLTPASVFLYIDHQLQRPVLLTIQPYNSWHRIASGLDSVSYNRFSAPGFDILYDCPILAGDLEEFPSFTVKGIPHRFIAYKPGTFDQTALMNDLKKIVETATKTIGDIPYKQYCFLGIGPGRGGIEHLSSSAVSFDGTELKTAGDKKRMLNFLAHEYFHNYNVKRIRPVELGPFDYDNGSKTRQLWISEGWTVYYEFLLLKRSGITSDSDLYKDIQTNILAYEKHNGKLHQSLAASSEETWSDGPFGNDPEKTISYYNKGPVVALMFDFAIRHFTKNKYSIDDVLRRLYNEYYKKGNRGFTEAEFKTVCQAVAHNKMTELFEYVYTTKELDYKKYFNYGGLNINVDDGSFQIHPLPQPDNLQSAILKTWLKGKF